MYRPTREGSHYVWLHEMPNLPRRTDPPGPVVTEGDMDVHDVVKLDRAYVIGETRGRVEWIVGTEVRVPQLFEY